VALPAKRINVTLDGEHARKLAELAAERHVEEVELAARSSLARWTTSGWTALG
jgi:hypothetical protein